MNTATIELRKHILRLSQINGPENFKADMIFGFDDQGYAVEAEMTDIPAKTAAEAAEKARVKWGYWSVGKIEESAQGASSSPLQTEWQMAGGDAEHWKEDRWVMHERPERDFPRHKRFVVRYETSFLTTKGDWTKPRTERDFRLADSPEEALASVKAHLHDPVYFVPGFHSAVNARVEPCPDIPACYDTYCRFDGAHDITNSAVKSGLRIAARIAEDALQPLPNGAPSLPQNLLNNVTTT